MGPSLLVNMSMAGRRELASMSGMMARVILVNGLRIKLKELVFIYGLTAEIMRASGMIIIWKELGFINGMMEGYSSDNICKIKNMVMVSTFGQIKGLTLGIGIMVNNMA